MKVKITACESPLSGSETGVLHRIDDDVAVLHGSQGMAAGQYLSGGMVCQFTHKLDGLVSVSANDQLGRV